MPVMVATVGIEVDVVAVELNALRGPKPDDNKLSVAAGAT
jgi:hypothetical protein